MQQPGTELEVNVTDSGEMLIGGSASSVVCCQSGDGDCDMDFVMVGDSDCEISFTDLDADSTELEWKYEDSSGEMVKLETTDGQSPRLSVMEEERSSRRWRPVAQWWGTSCTAQALTLIWHPRAR